MPTLQQLLNFFRDHALPANVDPAYRQATVAGLPVCTNDDEGLPISEDAVPQRHRLLGYPDNADNALFLPSNQVGASSNFAPPHDTLIRRLLSATGGLRYEEPLRNGNVAPSVLSLCRDASPLSGTGASAVYAVYAARNAILNHRNPGVPGLAPLSVRLTLAEIVAIVSGLRTAGGETFRVPEEHYAVNASDQGQLSLMPNAAEVRDLIAMIRSNDSPISAARRAVIVEGLNHLIDNGPANPAVLRRVAFSFRGSEIEDVTHGLRLPDGGLYSIPRDHYQVDPNDHSLLSLMPDRTEVEQLITLIERHDSPISAQRRSPMAAALREFIRAEASQAIVVEDQRRWPAWKVTILGAALGALFSAPIGALITWWMMKPQIRLQQRGLDLAEAQMEENRRLMSGEQAMPDGEERQRIFESVSRDLTADARAGRLDPVEGRDPEIAEISEILVANRLTGAQSPALIGDRGVGKTALFEALAQMVAEGRLPQYDRVIAIDIPSLVAGTGIRGSLETKLRVIQWMLENNPRTLFVMDEVHMIIGAGGTQGSSIDAAQILKATLARRGSNLVVGTTLGEYRQHIMRDEAFESRLAPVHIGPVSGEVRDRIFRRVRDFTLDLSRQMDAEAREEPRQFTISDEVIAYVGNIVGGNNREIKKMLGRIIARARTNTAAGASAEIAPQDVNVMTRVINVARRALGLAEFQLPPDFNEAHFAELIADRFPQFRNGAGQIHGHFRGFVTIVARMAHIEWNRRGRPVTQVGSLTIPNEAVIVEIADRLVRQAQGQNHAQAEELRRIYEARAESLELRGENAAREAFRRMEMIGR